MKMMNTYIIFSWREHLQESDDGLVVRVGWLGGRWGVTLYFISIFNFLCRLHQEAWVTAQIFQEEWKLNNTHNGPLKI